MPIDSVQKTRPGSPWKKDHCSENSTGIWTRIKTFSQRPGRRDAYNSVSKKECRESAVSIKNLQETADKIKSLKTTRLSSSYATILAKCQNNEGFHKYLQHIPKPRPFHAFAWHLLGSDDQACVDESIAQCLDIEEFGALFNLNKPALKDKGTADNLVKLFREVERFVDITVEKAGDSSPKKKLVLFKSICRYAQNKTKPYKALIELKNYLYCLNRSHQVVCVQQRDLNEILNGDEDLSTVQGIKKTAERVCLGVLSGLSEKDISELSTDERNFSVFYQDHEQEQKECSEFFAFLADRSYYSAKGGRECYKLKPEFTKCMLSTEKKFKEYRYHNPFNNFLQKIKASYSALFYKWALSKEKSALDNDYLPENFLADNPKIAKCYLHITDSRIDLCRLGTETRSCLHLLNCGEDTDESEDDDHKVTNIGVQGAVLDGKIKLLTVKTEDNQIVNRRVMRLIRDDNNNPVIHLDKAYSKLGYNQPEVDEAMCKYAMDYANELGVSIVIEQTLGSSEIEGDGKESVSSVTLISGEVKFPLEGGGFAPEYVDVNGGLRTDGFIIQTPKHLEYDL